jgi:ComF family protein
MSVQQSNFSLETTKAWPYEPESFPISDSLWVRVVDAVKEAFFPARCLTCGAFYRMDKPFRNSLKSILQVLKCKDLSAFILDTFSTAGNPCGDTFEYRSSTEANIFAKLMAPFLCAKCIGTFLAVESPICPSCGIIFKSRLGEDHLCGECIRTPKSYGMARSAGVYDKVLMAGIHCLKYKGKIRLARPLGVLLFFMFCRYWNKNRPDLIIPIPLHSKKLRRRGFNLSSLLVRDWVSMERSMDDGSPKVPVAEDILLRTRWTKSQTGLGRKDRLKNIKNAFSVYDPSRINGKKVLLIDDVYTTGATAEECTKVLVTAGASHVDVLTLARAM